MLGHLHPQIRYPRLESQEENSRRKEHEYTPFEEQVHHLQKKLLEEQVKVKALSEELENPQNVHRWRRLEGTDPETYELLKKIQNLQKRLIAKTEEVVEKELRLNEKEKMYKELKNNIVKRSGDIDVQKVNTMQATLHEKNKQLKSMASEINM